mgnify:CR=1 FL=1
MTKRNKSNFHYVFFALRLSSLILLIFFLSSIVLHPPSLVYAAVPRLLNYQGRLTDQAGKPLEGAYAITFRLYDAEAAGNLLWEETHQGAVIQKGVFNVLLGSVTNLNLAFDLAYFLEIKVGTEVMSPRQRITSAGYAVRAEEAEKLGGKLSSDYALATDITSTPSANKAVRLDAGAKLPLSALKVYDSGWFAVLASSSYTKTHNLGTTKVIPMIYFSQNSDGSGIVAGGFMHYVANYTNNSCMTGLTTAAISIRTGQQVVNQLDTNGNGYYWTSGYARIVMLALE